MALAVGSLLNAPSSLISHYCISIIQPFITTADRHLMSPQRGATCRLHVIQLLTSTGLHVISSYSAPVLKQEASRQKRAAVYCQLGLRHASGNELCSSSPTHGQFRNQSVASLMKPCLLQAGGRGSARSQRHGRVRHPPERRAACCDASRPAAGSGPPGRLCLCGGPAR